MAVKQHHFERMWLGVGFVEAGQFQECGAVGRRRSSCARVRSGRIGVRSGG